MTVTWKDHTEVARVSESIHIHAARLYALQRLILGMHALDGPWTGHIREGGTTCIISRPSQRQVPQGRSRRRLCCHATVPLAWLPPRGQCRAEQVRRWLAAVRHAPGRQLGALRRRVQQPGHPRPLRRRCRSFCCACTGCDRRHCAVAAVSSAVAAWLDGARQARSPEAHQVATARLAWQPRCAMLTACQDP